jgi:hypothetical protein
MDKDKNDLEYLMNFIIEDMLKIKMDINIHEVISLNYVLNDIYILIKSDIAKLIKNLTYEDKKNKFIRELVIISDIDIREYQKLDDNALYNAIFNNYSKILDENIRNKNKANSSLESLINLNKLHKLLKEDSQNIQALRSSKSAQFGGTEFPIINWKEPIKPSHLQKLNILIDDIKKLSEENSTITFVRSNMNLISDLSNSRIDVFDKLTHLLSIFDWKIKEVEIRDFNPNCVIDEFILEYYDLLEINKLLNEDRRKLFKNIHNIQVQHGGLNKRGSKKANSKRGSKKANSKRGSKRGSKKRGSKRGSKKRGSKRGSKKCSKKK